MRASKKKEKETKISKDSKIKILGFSLIIYSTGAARVDRWILPLMILN